MHNAYTNSRAASYCIGTIKTVTASAHIGLAIKTEKTRMWASAQRDGRPAEYRWRPSMTPTSRVPCINAAKTRNPLKFAGVPKLTTRSQPLVGRSSPYCQDMWGGRDIAV